MATTDLSFLIPKGGAKRILASRTKARLAELQKELEAWQAIQTSLEQGAQIVYKVTIKSRWTAAASYPSPGEQDVELEGDNLKKLLSDAAEKFMSVNHRTDIQADVWLYAAIKGSDSWILISSH